MFDFGIYRFKRELTGYRADYCLRCECERIAEQWQSFEVLRYSFLPVLPLGTRRRWRCGTCGRNPHSRVRTSLILKWAGLILCLLFSFVAWASPPRGDDVLAIWLMRVLMPACVVALGLSLRRHRAAPILKERLARVEPLSGGACLFCHGPLAGGEVPRCSACGLERHRVA